MTGFFHASAAGAVLHHAVFVANRMMLVRVRVRECQMRMLLVQGLGFGCPAMRDWGVHMGGILACIPGKYVGAGAASARDVKRPDAKLGFESAWGFRAASLLSSTQSSQVCLHLRCSHAVLYAAMPHIASTCISRMRPWNSAHLGVGLQKCLVMPPSICCQGRDVFAVTGSFLRLHPHIGIFCQKC